MNFEVVSYCIDIAKTKNFTKTAEKFHISQQGMSQQIKSLERELNMQLFERSNRAVRVTAAGNEFLSKAAIAMEQLEDAVRCARAISDGRNGYLFLGYNGPSSQRYLSRVLERFVEDFPQIEVNLTTGTNREVLDKFIYGPLDLIAVGDFEVFNPEQYNVIQWNAGVVNAVVGKTHPFAQRKSISQAELLEEPYISLDFRKTPHMLERSMRRCEAILGEAPRAIRYYESTDTIDIIVSSGVGFTMLNSDLKGYYKNSSLVFVEIEGATTVHYHKFVWKKDNSNPALNYFIQSVERVKALKELEDLNTQTE